MSSTVTYSTSMGTVYLLITDLHWKRKKVFGRVSYDTEREHALKNIIQIIDKYKEQGYTVVLIFLGDIFDCSYEGVFDAIADNNQMISLRMRAGGGAFGVIGNHEFTYYKDNPFWTLFTDMKSDKVASSVNRLWAPKGTIQVLDIVDELVDGDVRFIFNHYGCPVSPAPVDGKVNIGLFHLDLYAKDIVKDVEGNKLGVRIFEHTPHYFDNSRILHGYDYAYLGHAHMFYGKWVYTCDLTGYKTRIQYLSTLGRTNNLEIRNDFLQRNIPAIVVKDGKFVREEDNYFYLMDRESCVIEEVVLSAKEAREELKARKEFRSTVQLTEDPIDNISASLEATPAFKSLFDEILSTGDLRRGRQLLREVDELRWM